jgi:hypothetical protein
VRQALNLIDNWEEEVSSIRIEQHWEEECVAR